MSTMWVDVVYATPPALPAALQDRVDTTPLDPANWALLPGLDLPTVRAFRQWRGEFVHTLQLGPQDHLVVAAAWMRRKGDSFAIDEPGYLDHAAITSAWWAATDHLPDTDEMKNVKHRLGAAAAVARTCSATARLRLGKHSWPVSRRTPSPS